MMRASAPRRACWHALGPPRGRGDDLDAVPRAPSRPGRADSPVSPAPPPGIPVTCSAAGFQSRTTPSWSTWKTPSSTFASTSDASARPVCWSYRRAALERLWRTAPPPRASSRASRRRSRSLREVEAHELVGSPADHERDDRERLVARPPVGRPRAQLRAGRRTAVRAILDGSAVAERASRRRWPSRPGRCGSSRRRRRGAVRRDHVHRSPTGRAAPF